MKRSLSQILVPAELPVGVSVVLGYRLTVATSSPCWRISHSSETGCPGRCFHSISHRHRYSSDEKHNMHYMLKWPNFASKWLRSEIFYIRSRPLAFMVLGLIHIQCLGYATFLFFVFYISLLCACAYCLQSESAPHSPVKIKMEESNNSNGEEVSNVSDIYGFCSSQIPSHLNATCILPLKYIGTS